MVPMRTVQALDVVVRAHDGRLACVFDIKGMLCSWLHRSVVALATGGDVLLGTLIVGFGLV